MILTERSDIELVILCKDGHKEMFNELVRRYYKPIFSYVFAKVMDKHMSEDVVQEVFLAAYNSLSRIENPSSFSAWHNSIARNQLSMKLRDLRKTPVGAGALDTRQDVSDERIERISRLREAFSMLPEEHQQILSMRFHNNMSCQEIARTLGKPLGTVTSTITRAYKALKNGMMKEA
jgi:RNA polymerase sigma-70 factor (ECF subfamily)